MSKLFSLAILAVLLVAAPLKASPIEEEKGAYMGPHKNKIYSIDLERKDAPAEAKIKLIQLLQEHHNDLKLDKAEGASFLQKKRKTHTHLHEIKLGNMQNAQVAFLLFSKLLVSWYHFHRLQQQRFQGYLRYR